MSAPLAFLVAGLVFAIPFGLLLGTFLANLQIRRH
jgi:uncharacterized protein YneF (UPF0154 family)